MHSFEKQLFFGHTKNVTKKVDLMTLFAGRSRIEILQGDITEQSTDAIVNAANSSLMGGGGVDGAIHRKGGPSILEECQKIRSALWKDGLPPGKAVITRGGRLKARYVIHTVGPVWHGGQNGEPETLMACYSNSLLLAASKELKSLSFPAISTGAYGYPIEMASEIALQTTNEFLLRNQRTSIQEFSFVLFTQQDLRIYEDTAKRILVDYTET